MSGVKHPGPILVLDDRADVLRSLGRYFRLHFEAVVTATTPAAATQAIAEHRPPFLLCDYWLGEEHPPSPTLIRGWRRDYPFIVRVAVMTGSDRVAAVSSDGVDAVFAKPFDLGQVASFFTAPRSPS